MYSDEFNFCSPPSEEEIVYFNNNVEIPPHVHYYPDPINVYNLNGEHIGYSWNYGDSVELCLDINDTVLHVDPSRIDELAVYISDKEVEFNFIDIRGNLKYTFYEKPRNENGLKIKLRLNTNEENFIDRNTYKVTAVLVNPYDLSRINLFTKPYEVYVK